MEFRRPYKNSGVTVPANTADYIIYGEDTNGDGIADIIYAKNGKTGEVEFKGTDATSVIQNTLNNGNYIHIKGGEYDIKTPILVQDKGNVIIEGDGWNTVLNQKNDNNCIRFVGVENSVIRDIFIDAQYTTNTTNNEVIEIARSEHVLIDHIKLFKAPDFGIFIYAPATGDTIDVTVQNSYLTGVGNSDVIGGGVAIGATTEISDITIQNNYIVQGYGGSGTYGQAISLNKVRKVQIVHNKTKGGISYSGESSPNEYSIIANNLVEPAENNVTPRIEVTTGDNGLNYVTISDNTVINGKINVIGTTVYALRVNLIGNQINATGLPEAIYITKLSLGTIVANTTQGATYSVLLDSSSKISVLGNIFLSSQYAVYEQNGSFGNKVAFNILNNVTSGIYLTGTDSKMYQNYGWKTENDGTTTFTGDGTTTTFSTAHGLVAQPSKYFMQALNDLAKNYSTFSADATYLYVNFSTAPPSGSTLNYYWYAEV